jgi:hypothetical protein
MRRPWRRPPNDMTGETGGDALRKRHIILVHEDAFAARYLADVLTHSGAAVTRLPACDLDAIVREAVSRQSALVVSDAAPDGAAITDTAAALGIPCVILRSARRASPGVTGACVPNAPFAGFQVVEMVNALLGPGSAAGTTPADPALHGQ